MIVTCYRDGMFECISSYHERDAPKRAGFRWNAAHKRWQTGDWQRAAALESYCDEAARAAIVRARGVAPAPVEVREDASRAVDCDLEIPCPEGLAFLGYQRAGIAFALGRDNTLIADDMGLGKTVQAIGVINADSSIRSALIICPASLRINWRREAKRWLTRDLSIGIALDCFPQTDIVICNYERLGKHRAAIRARSWDIFVADEAHYLKNPKSQRSREVFGRPKRGEQERITPIAARRRVFMTGTPILNRPVELWPILHSFGWKSWLEFVTRYCAGYRNTFGWDVSGASNLDELQAKLRSTCMIRRRKDDVLKELPPKRRQVIELPANGAASQLSAEQAFMRGRLPQGREEDWAGLLVTLQRDDPIGFAELSRVRHDTARAKVPAVIEHVCDLLEGGVEKVVVWGHHTDVIRAIAGGLNGSNYDEDVRAMRQGIRQGGGQGAHGGPNDVREAEVLFPGVCGGTPEATPATRGDCSGPVDGAGPRTIEGFRRTNAAVPVPMRDSKDGSREIAPAGDEAERPGRVNGMRDLRTGSDPRTSPRGQGRGRVPDRIRDADQGEESGEEGRASVQPDPLRHHHPGSVSSPGDPAASGIWPIQRQQPLLGQDHSKQGLHPGKRLGDKCSGQHDETQRNSRRAGTCRRQSAKETRDYGVVIFTGKETPEERQAAVDRFQSDSATRVFVGSIAAAGVGITLTAASTCVFAELSWVPGEMSQAEDREHRIGQANSVLVQHLVLEGSLDAMMAETLVRKQEVIDRALDVPRGAR